MKPFLGIDLTRDKKNERINGSEFLVQEPSVALSESLKVSMKESDKTIEKAKLPLPLRTIQFTCGIIALLIIGAILKADVSLTVGYQNAPYLFWIAGICAVIWLILWIWSKQKAKTVLEASESIKTFSELDKVAYRIYDELSVPDDAKSVDILSFFYKIKDGNIKMQTKGMQTALCFNPEFRVFADTQNLYLANLDGKYAFPLYSIIALRTIKKRISIIGWNKEQPFNKGFYKQYKLTVNNYGSVFCKYYHILEVNHQSETFEIYIPCYESSVFEELIGLKAEHK
jgi:hypothetical protein